MRDSTDSVRSQQQHGAWDSPTTSTVDHDAARLPGEQREQAHGVRRQKKNLDILLRQRPHAIGDHQPDSVITSVVLSYADDADAHVRSTRKSRKCVEHEMQGS